MSTDTSLAARVASQKRAQHPDFVPTFSLAALQPQLPLRFPAPADVPTSCKHQYRSAYQYPGYAELADPVTLTNLEPFEVALHLIDFSPLRNYLAQCYLPSARGQTPFDPVSLLLAACLRRELNIGWRRLARLLAGRHGPGWRRLLGFRDGCTPSASGLRYFYNAVGPARCEDLCSQVADLLHQASLLPDHSTYPGDPPDRGVTISHDIMLHEANSNLDCAQVTDTCYQPAPRPCPAQAAGREGCTCQDAACAQICRRATPADPEARFIHYEGCNKEADLPNHPTRGGRDVYGYASNPDRLLDERFACAWTLRTGLHPANSDERNLFPDSFAALQARLPWLHIGEVLADAALGYQNCLDPIWEAGALRLVDTKATTSRRSSCFGATTPTAGPCVPMATLYGPTATTTSAAAPSGVASRPASIMPGSQRPTARSRSIFTARSSTSAAPCPMAACAWPARCLTALTPGKPATAAATCLKAATPASKAWASLA